MTTNQKPISGIARVEIDPDSGGVLGIYVGETRIVETDCGFCPPKLPDAQRLVDCWNACVDIPNPTALRQQRDDLLEALKLCSEELVQNMTANEPGGAMDRALQRALAKAINAIAKAEGKFP